MGTIQRKLKMAQLLIETQLWNTNSLLTENVKKENGNIIVEGILATAEVKNGNGRYYPRELWEREMDKYQEAINNRTSTGELDHPEKTVVELKNVSHIVREAYMQGDDVYGKIEILDTPSGKIIQSLIESGVTLGISSRGVGSTVNQSGNQVVQDDFQLICFDMVSEPSTPGAFMLKEHKISRRELDKFFNQSDKIDRMFNDILRW